MACYSAAPPRRRETYVVDGKGEVVSVHNNQFGPETHITTALEALVKMPAPAGFEFPDFSELLAGLTGAGKE